MRSNPAVYKMQARTGTHSSNKFSPSKMVRVLSVASLLLFSHVAFGAAAHTGTTLRKLFEHYCEPSPTSKSHSIQPPLLLTLYTDGCSNECCPDRGDHCCNDSPGGCKSLGSIANRLLVTHNRPQAAPPVGLAKLILWVSVCARINVVDKGIKPEVVVQCVFDMSKRTESGFLVIFTYITVTVGENVVTVSKLV